MSEGRRCSNCGTRVPGDAAEGLCLVCVALGAIGAEPDSGASAEALVSELSRALPLVEGFEFVRRGAQGLVFKARHRYDSDRLLAIKVQVDSGPAGERLTREAKVLCAMRHEGIVQINDFGRTSSGRFFIVMEYLEVGGWPATKQPVEPPLAIHIVKQVCESLRYAHSKGVIHRDLKPGNLLVDRNHHVRVADFGLAKLLGGAVPAEETTEDGTRAGTDPYWAPEQRENARDAKEPADIYSTGVLLYELLTGRASIGLQPASSSLGSEYAVVGRELDLLLERMLQPAPALRPSAAEVVRSLHRLEDMLDDATAPRMAREFWRWVAGSPLRIGGIAAGAAVTLGLAIGLAASGGPDRVGTAMELTAGVIAAWMLVFALLTRRLGLPSPRDASAAEIQPTRLFHRLWIALLGSWSLLYLSLFLVPLLGTGVAPEWARLWRTGSQVWLDLVNNSQSALLFLLYFVMNENTSARSPATPWRRVALAVLAAAAVEGFIFWGAGSEVSFAAARDRIALFGGVVGGAALALFLGRLESKFIFPPGGVKGLLYLYAGVQPLYALFYREQVWEHWATVVLWSYGLVGKTVLFLFVYWTLEKGRMLFYMAQIREVHLRVRRLWEDYQGSNLGDSNPR